MGTEISEQDLVRVKSLLNEVYRNDARLQTLHPEAEDGDLLRVGEYVLAFLEHPSRPLQEEAVMRLLQPSLAPLKAFLGIPRPPVAAQG